MLDLNCWEYKFKLCNYSKKLLNKILLLNKFSKDKVDFLAIKKAIYYAKKYHANQKRQTGEPYYSHPLAVAYMVMDYHFNTDTIVTSILHDTIEDTQFTKNDIEEIFGSTIATKVEHLSKIKNYSGFKSTSEEMVNSLLTQHQDSLLLIKYFDRLHNMQTINIKNPHKIRTITNETLKIFFDVGEYLKINLNLQDQLMRLCTKQ